MDTVGRISETKEVGMKWLKRLIWQWNLSDDVDFDKELGKMITMESMRM